MSATDLYGLDPTQLGKLPAGTVVGAGQTEDRSGLGHFNPTGGTAGQIAPDPTAGTPDGAPPAAPPPDGAAPSAGGTPTADPYLPQLNPGNIIGAGQSEDTSGSGHFNPTGGDVYQVSGTTGTGGAPPAGAPPAAAPAPGDSPPSTGLLSGPGPGEVYDSSHAHDFDNPSNVETLYGQHGGDPFSGPSNSQKLFDEGMAGNDPFFNYAIDRSNKNINDTSAARGGFNSGAAIQAIGNATANLRGQQAEQLYSLAPAADSAERNRMQQGFDFANDADTSRTNRIGAGMGINDDWQKQQQDRLTGGLNAETDIDKAKAGITESGYQSATNIFNTDGLAGIEAALQKAGINPTGDATKDFITLAGLGVKAGTGGK